jgi:hypothetical protein
MSDDQEKIKIAREPTSDAQTSLNCSRKMPNSISLNSDLDLRQAMIHGLVKNGGSVKHVQQHIDLIDPQSSRSLR